MLGLARSAPVPLLPALLLALAALPAAAQPYRYVDENGVTVYSQTPPPGGVEGTAERVPIAPGPDPAETAAARERIRRQIETDFDARDEAERAEAQQAEEAAAAASRAEACEGARRNLDTLTDLGARRLRMPDGSMRRLGDTEREEMIRETRSRISELCN